MSAIGTPFGRKLVTSQPFKNNNPDDGPLSIGSRPRNTLTHYLRPIRENDSTMVFANGSFTTNQQSHRNLLVRYVQFWNDAIVAQQTRIAKQIGVLGNGSHVSVTHLLPSPDDENTNPQWEESQAIFLQLVQNTKKTTKQTGGSRQLHFGRFLVSGQCGSLLPLARVDTCPIERSLFGNG